MSSYRWRLSIVALFLLTLLAAVPTEAYALDFNDLVRLKRAGVAEETILKVVEVEQAVFFLSVDDLIALKEVGATEWFLRELMDTPERYGRPASEDAYYEAPADWDDEDDSLDLADYETVFVHHYYDPFGYYWYPWPRTYLYYAPFSWNRVGFYFAGHWSWDWWDPWGPCARYCDSRWGWRHHFGQPRPIDHRPTMRAWHRAGHAVGVRAERERSIARHAESPRPAHELRVRSESQRARVRSASLTRSARRPSEVSSARMQRAPNRSRVTRTARYRRPTAPPTNRESRSRKSASSRLGASSRTSSSRGSSANRTSRSSQVSPSSSRSSSSTPSTPPRKPARRR